MIKIKVVNKGHQQLPRYATPMSAGMDLRANLDEPITLQPMQRALVKTGLYIALPEGYEAQIRPRQLFATPRTVACQALLSVGLPRQGYWSGLLCPPPGDLPRD